MKITSDMFWDHINMDAEKRLKAFWEDHKYAKTPVPVDVNDHELAEKRQPILDIIYELHNQYLENCKGVEDYWNVGKAIKIAPKPTSPYDENGFAHGVTTKPGDKWHGGEAWQYYNDSDQYYYALRTGIMDYVVDIPEHPLLYYEKTNLPGTNYLDTAIERYTKLYEKIHGKEDIDDLHLLRLVISELDKALVKLTKDAFASAGLSKDNANFLGEEFCRTFRFAMIDGNSIEESYIDALRRLNSLSPDLMDVTQYSKYGFDMTV